MGRWKAVIPIFLALAIAVAGSVMFYRWMESRTAPTETAGTAEKKQAETVPVVVAAADIQWGTKIEKEMLKTAEYLKSSVPNGYFSDIKEVEGRVLISPLKTKDPVTASRLASTDIKSGGVSAVLEKGRRAVAVKGDKVLGLSGLVKPGNRVDVLVTMKNPENGEDITKQVLENISVLATGTVIEDKNGEPSPVDVYTLEVSPEQAEKLALASNKGRLQFALRNITDSESVATKGAGAAETLNYQQEEEEKSAPEKKQAAKPKPTPRTRYTVEVINGKNLNEKKF